MSVTSSYALSVRQPWAALIVLGIKTIEIRRWPLAYRGQLLIHASSYPDKREHGWQVVPPEGACLARLRGGVIGRVNIVDCRQYHSRRAFLAERRYHHNHPSWFEPNLFGFIFEQPQLLPYFAVKGNVRLFRVNLPEPVIVTGPGGPERVGAR
jgi:hypothetical protein